MSISLIWGSVNVAEVYRSWQDHPVKTVVADYYFEAHGIPFPVVTLTARQVRIGSQSGVLTGFRPPFFLNAQKISSAEQL